RFGHIRNLAASFCLPACSINRRTGIPCFWYGGEMYQFSTTTVLTLMIGFYLITFLMTLLIREKKENVDGYMVSNGSVGFGISAASMTATWIWAASFYAAASSGYTYGLSGPLHYGFWGALMILFIYPFGRRFREVAPKAHTLAEVVHARHGSSSQMILVISNIMGSLISLMVNFTAAEIGRASCRERG